MSEKNRMHNWLIIAVPICHSWVGKHCQGGRRKLVMVISAQGGRVTGALRLDSFPSRVAVLIFRRRECHSLFKKESEVGLAMVHGGKPSAAHLGQGARCAGHGLELKVPCTLRAFGNASFHPSVSRESGGAIICSVCH